jgi:protein O-mannose beta-1,4-N-acetylglucosaminyltransferase
MGTELTSCFATFAGLQLCTQGPVSSLEEKQKDETFAWNGDAAGVAVVSAASTDPAADGGKDEVPEKDDDPSAVAALPPLSSDSLDSTQESGHQEAASLN